MEEVTKDKNILELSKNFYWKDVTHITPNMDRIYF